MEKYFYFMECVTKTKEGHDTSRIASSYVTTKSSLLEARQEWHEKLLSEEKKERQEKKLADLKDSPTRLIRFGIFYLITYTKGKGGETAKRIYFVDSNENEEASKARAEKSLKEEDGTFEITEFSRIKEVDKKYISTLFSHFDLGDDMNQEINELNTKIKGFEQKYECSFEDFQARFHEMKQFSMFEKEDDGMNWESYLAFCADYEKLLKQL